MSVLDVCFSVSALVFSVLFFLYEQYFICEASFLLQHSFLLVPIFLHWTHLLFLLDLCPLIFSVPLVLFLVLPSFLFLSFSCMHFFFIPYNTFCLCLSFFCSHFCMSPPLFFSHISFTTPALSPSPTFPISICFFLPAPFCLPPPSSLVLHFDLHLQSLPFLTSCLYLQS